MYSINQEENEKTYVKKFRVIFVDYVTIKM